MKFNFKKISAIATSALLTGMTMGVAAAASYPAPFVVGGTADVAVVYGTGTGVSTLDLIQAGNIQSDLQSHMGSASGTTTSVTGGDSLLIAKDSDRLNLNNRWTDVFTGTIDDDDLSTLLADGTFIANDNDEFSFEQKITLGNPRLEHFRDSDYESLAGLSDKTPTVGFKISSNVFIMNYTLDFTQDAESDISGGDLEDIEGADLVLMGKTYYVSDLDNGTSATYLGKLTLLDSATTGIVSEGETITMNVDDTSYEVSLAFISSSEVKISVNGETTNSLAEGQSYKLSDGTYVGVKDITKLEVSGETGSVEFSLGSGKLEITSASDIKLNDNTINGVKGYVHQGTASGNAEKIDKIVIEWKTDDEEFLTPETELTMPGFGAMKFSMNNLVRPTEEKVTIEKDSDTSIQLTVPIKDGDASINILYSNSSGEFEGIGKASDDRLATSSGSTLLFYEKESGSDYHSYFVASYNISAEAESYLLKAKVTQDTDNARNETTIQKYSNGAWTTVCEEKTEGDTCDIGDVSLTVTNINFTSGGNESVLFTRVGNNVNFNTVYTTGGLRIYLPFAVSNVTTPTTGSITLGAYSGNTTAGYDWSSYYLFMDGEDKDDNIADGTEFNFTINDNTDGNLQVSEVNGAGTGGSATGASWGGLEQDDSSTYETYMKDDVSARILHYTQADEDSAEVYYPTGDSETYAEVFLAESGAVVTGGTATAASATQLGDVLVKDTEVSSVSSKNLIVVGGSCINSAAAKVLGVSDHTCGAAFTTATGVGSGEFLIKGVSGAYTAGKIALVVAGYEAADTVNAATYLRNQVVDTSKEYKGTSSTSATMVTTEA